MPSGTPGQIGVAAQPRVVHLRCSEYANATVEDSEVNQLASLSQVKMLKKRSAQLQCVQVSICNSGIRGKMFISSLLDRQAKLLGLGCVG